MKAYKFAAMLCAAFLIGLTTGCIAPATIEASSTKLSSSPGKSLEISLPKELDATNLEVSVDPASGVVKLKAEKLRSSSQGVIQSAGSVQAETMNKLATAVDKALTLAVPIAGAAAGIPIVVPSPATTTPTSQ